MLRAKLNKMPIGVPKGLNGEEKEILRILFSKEEAEFALKLPLMPSKLEDISAKMGMDEEAVKTALDRMARKGVVFKEEKQNETFYRLLPSIVGWAETPFWAGPGKDDRQEKLASLWHKYRTTAFLDEVGDRDTSIVRTLPEKEAISPETQVMPYEDAVKLVKDREYHAVAHCPCRIIARLEGEGCKHSLENCLHFGSMGQYMVKQGLGRRISADEALKILKKANREGLVHAIENHSGRLNVLCNCCEDCCIWFQSIYKAKHPNTLAKSNYFAEVDPEKCIACGICTIRCPMHAIAVKRNKESAKVKKNRCIGCGVCHPTCAGDAIRLVKRDKTTEPLEYQDYVMNLLKDRDKDVTSLFE